MNLVLSNEFLKFVGLAFFVWRLSHMLVREDGFFEVFKRLREAVGLKRVLVGVDQIEQSVIVERFDERYKKLNYIVRQFAEGLDCVYCTSVWVSGVTSLIFIQDGLLIWFFYAIALSGVALWIEAHT